MKVKTCPITVKTAGSHEGVDEGVFEAVVAAYNVDSVGDRIIPGAFGKTLADWKASGNPIPVIWSHKSDDPDYHIGHVLDAEERKEGLWIKAQIDIDDPRSKAAQVYRLLKGRRVTQMSFAYDEVDARPVEKSESGATKELHELKVHEVGPCLIGTNRETALLGVKHDEQVRKAKVWTKVDVDGSPAPGQVCEDCAAPGHINCFDAKTEPPTISDAIEGIKASGVLSKEHVPAVTSLLADLAAGMTSIADVLDALKVSDETEQKATPAQSADSSAPEAKEQPARPGTASVRTSDDLTRLAFLEAEQAVDTD